jgi:hypothetical protein
MVLIEIFLIVFQVINRYWFRNCKIVSKGVNVLTPKILTGCKYVIYRQALF